MSNKISILFAAVSVALISGCTNTQKSNQIVNISPVLTQNSELNKSDPLIAEIIETDVSQLWDQNFNHHRVGLLESVANGISAQTSLGILDDSKLDKLTYYLRIYSSFGPDKNWPEHTAETLNSALLNLQNMPGFYEINATTARLHENYAVALYRLYFLEPLQGAVTDHVKPLTKLIELYSSNQLPEDKAIDYALWEVLRASAILPYEARRKNQAAYIKGIQGDGELEQALLAFLTSKNAILKGDNWPQKHAVWALAQYYNIYNKQYWNEYYTRSEDDKKKLDEDKLTLPFEISMNDLDEAVWTAITADKTKSIEQAKEEFSIPYVVTTFRGKSDCKEGSLKDRCIAPTIEQVLPIKHVCSSSLYILTQHMTQEQLTDSCTKLTSQEDVFHEKLKTNNQPAANDFNDELRVVVFDNAAEYNKYGQLVFDIHTDNGGMYIEGTTQDPNNIATFYSYEHFWVRPEFKVWNLNHEYVHYLDGRFIKYDTYGHFPSHLVWWSEGLAEYISKADDNPKAFTLMAETEQNKWPTLQDVFNTQYKDGTDRVYKWGYLAVRFMYENHAQEYRKMAHFLKTDYFEGYKELLDSSGKAYEQEFTDWLIQHKANFTVSKEKVDPKKPRQFYRYTYKDYLQPEHLTEDKLHMHWQYWHENARNNNTIAKTK